ncbi:DUF3488 and transglutaminase-like domain-containing protein [Nocardioides sp. AE5]|uniref:transglutaminase family protein n=1 Tax=Nocardioides sp. AE5 TaxID=2962573 RepID=UPI002882A15A|nr:DUF3488 and transglutaminase-like domain-containing protein [Nocardioides sp. AE5]MDT0201244.1 DUF3488 and transglutaminase-like domain-containing protein [Nocardioides sp. AE5]
MSRRRSGLATAAIVLTAAATSWVALLAWRGFAAPSSKLLVLLLLGIGLTSAVGAVARRVRMPLPFVVSSQLLGILVYLNGIWGSGPLPTPASVRTTSQAFVDSVDILQTYAAPVPAELHHALPVLVGGGLLCHLFVDLLAVTIGRAALAGLPLLVVHALPVSILERSVQWWVFVLAAVGFMAMLALEENSVVGRWGRGFGADGTTRGTGPLASHDPQRHPLTLGVAAVLLALVVPLALPTMGLDLLGSDDGNNPGDDEIRIMNPMTDLRRDLVRGEDIGLLRVRTTGAEPEYLRTAVLTVYDGEAWRPGDRSLSENNTADGEMPRPIGLGFDVPTSSQEWTIAALPELKSLWLPTPGSVSAVRAGKDWRYDAAVLDIHSANSRTTTAGLTYSLTEMIPRITGDDLAQAGDPPSRINSTYGAPPAGLPGSVAAAAEEVTEGAETDFEKALALQDWFRNSGGFTYSLEPNAGNGNNALAEFLEDRVGYCEQFSSAMAVMARHLGIPARVSVGFYRAEVLDNGLYEFSSHDLHAWPELYFAGYGWVRFEPTPASHIGTVPPYTTDEVDDPTSTEAPTDQPTEAPTSAAPSSAAPSQAPDVPEAQGNTDQDNFSWTPVLWVLGILLVLVALLLAPRLLRRGRTARRWNGDLPPIEAAWSELRDVCLDLGRGWPAGKSPRATGAAVTRWFGPPEQDRTVRLPQTGPQINPEATAAIRRLVVALEAHRYAARPDQDEVSVLRSDVALCTQALENGVSRDTRIRATWTPRSLLRRDVPLDDKDEPLVGDHAD